MTSASSAAMIEAVERAETRFARIASTERLKLRRLRLQATIDSVSPLTRDIAALHGFDLDAVARMLEARDPRALGDRRAGIFPDWKRRSAIGDLLGRPDDFRMFRRIRREGVVLPMPQNRRPVGFVPLANVLESGGWLAGSWFATSGRFARLVVRGSFPEGVCAAARGRPIGSMVAHPLLDGRQYPIMRMAELPDDAGTVIAFRTGVLPHVMPWGDLLAAEMEMFA